MKIINIFNICLLALSVAAHADSDADRYKSLLDQAKADAKAGSYKSAIKSYKKVYSKSNLHKSEALRGLVATYINTKKYDEAVEILKEEISANQFVGDYKVMLASVYSADEKHELSLAEINSAEKIMGSTKPILKAKSISLRKMNMHPEAIMALNAYLKIEPKDHSALVDKGESHFALKQYDQAFSDAAAAYDARSFDERVLSFYTKAAYYNNNFVEAKKIGKKCNELFPKNEQCLEYLGRASYQTKEYPMAIKFFESYLDLNNNQPEVQLLYAESLALNGNDVESDKQFIQTLKLQPDYEVAMRSWAKFLNQRKKIESLGVALKSFCENNPSNVWAAIELSKLLFLVGDQEAGLDRMDTLMSESKSDQGKYFNAYFLDTAGKHSKARGYLEKIKDKGMEINFSMGIAYVKDKKFKDAIKHWSLIKSDSPNYMKAQINIALATEQLGQVVKAKEMLSTLAIAAPAEYKVALEQKISSMGNEDRKPANDSPRRGIDFLLEWSLPQL